MNALKCKYFSGTLRASLMSRSCYFRSPYIKHGIWIKCHRTDTNKMPQCEKRTKCHRICTDQKCNNECYNGVTNV